ncbi:MAG: mRNA surveillance protein pelota, partial [Candidatus Thermoplasmatota archaeon]|nr:mRNA surveillance protein pelota [Candidatus Thermoplasmatota archaeon]
RSHKAEKKTMTLTIKCEKIEFVEFSNRLRVLGVITEGPQDHGCHHTLNIESGYRVTVFKDQWKKHDIDTIQMAVVNAKKPTVVFLAIEDDNAVIALLRQYGLEVICDIKGAVCGKLYKQKNRGKKEFFAEVTERLCQMLSDNTPLVIIGPGFTKDEFYRLASRDHPDLFKSTYLKATGQAGVAGINEALKLGIKNLYATEARVLKETQLMDDLLTGIATEANVTYGEKYIKRGLELSAVEKLLLTDRMVRDGNGESLIELARETGANVAIVSTAHEAGKRLEALGGTAAFLRFKIDGL